MKRLWTFFSFLLAWVLWEVVSHQLEDPQLFPHIHHIFERIFELFQSPEFLNDLLMSFLRLCAGLSISAPLALFFGVLVGRSELLDRLLSPVLSFVYPLPKVALLPLMAVFLGIGDSSKIVLIALGTFFLCFVNIRQGMKTIFESPLFDVMTLYSPTSLFFWYHFVIKGLRPFLIAGLRLALGYGLTLIVVTEMSMAQNGLGHFIWRAWDQYRLLDLYAGIFIIGGFGFFFDFIFSKTAISAKESKKDTWAA